MLKSNATKIVLKKNLNFPTKKNKLLFFRLEHFNYPNIRNRAIHFYYVRTII